MFQHILVLLVFTLPVIHASKACYTVTFDFDWDESDTGFLPDGNEHFAPPLIVAYNPNEGNLFVPDEPAWPGLATLAEMGNPNYFATQLEKYREDISRDNIYVGSLAEAPFSSPMTVEDVCVTEENNAIQILSMIAPSPDWFLSVRFSNLWQTDEFVETDSITLTPSHQYDAGTDSGLEFGSPNCPTRDGPNRVVKRLSEAGNVVIQLSNGEGGSNIGTISLQRTQYDADGEWGEWVPQGSCSETCNGGDAPKIQELRTCEGIQGNGAGCARSDGTVATNSQTESRRVSCNVDVECNPGELQCYTIYVAFDWDENDGRDAGYPPNQLILEHFSPPLGVVTSTADAPLANVETAFITQSTDNWPGLEQLAETGNPSRLAQTFGNSDDVNQVIMAAGPAFRPFDEYPILMRDVCVTATQNTFTMFAMLAPSPDHFVAAQVQLHDGANFAPTSDPEGSPLLTSEVVFDAGTDSFDGFLPPDNDADDAFDQDGTISRTTSPIVTDAEIGRWWVIRHPVDGEWGPWSEWGECNSECNGGVRTRTRTCANDASNCGSDTSQNEETQYGNCNSIVPCPGHMDVCYKVTLTSTWEDGTLTNEHFSPFIALASKSDPPATWYPGAGTVASDGLEMLAEQGIAATLVQEFLGGLVDDVRVEVASGGPNAATTPAFTVGDTPGDELCMTPYRNLLSVYSMIAPSPDWFLHAAFRPFRSGEWAEEMTLPCTSNNQFDAGTDAGTEFTSADDDEDSTINTLADTERDRVIANPCSITITRTNDKPRYKPWEEWSECSSSCRGGSQMRTRECLTHPSTCVVEDMVEYRECNRWTPCAGEICYTLRWHPTWMEAAGELGEAGNDGEHFSPITIIVSRDPLEMFGIGQQPNMAVEQLAERGNNAYVLKEVAQMDGSYSIVALPSFIGENGLFRDQWIENICVTADMNQVTIVSMIAPSPDWFIYYRFSPLVRTEPPQFEMSGGGEEGTAPEARDAGSDDGDLFTSPDADTADANGDRQIRTLASAGARAGGDHVTALTSIGRLWWWAGNAPRVGGKCCNPLKEPSKGDNLECPNGDAICCPYTGQWECPVAGSDDTYTCPVNEEGDACGTAGRELVDTCGGGSATASFTIQFNNYGGGCQDEDM